MNNFEENDKKTGFVLHKFDILEPTLKGLMQQWLFVTHFIVAGNETK